MPEDIPEAFVSFDFRTTFPWVYWVSDWASDESYPEGLAEKRGGFRHSILFQTGTEITIVFTKFRFEVVKATQAS